MTEKTHRDFLAIPDYSGEGLLGLFDRAERMRTAEHRETPRAGQAPARLSTRA